MELSNISTRPFCEHSFKSFNTLEKAILVHSSRSGSLANGFSSGLGMQTSTSVSWCAPLVSRKALEILTISLPLHWRTRRGSAVTSATIVASKFSSSEYFKNSWTSFGATTTAILSWDSEIAISVPSRPAYFLGTLSRLTISPSANSPIATDTPPAPKSLHFLIRRLTSSRLNNLWIFLSVGGLPFWTSAPQVSIDSSVWALEEPVAPPQPSRPVLPPKRMIISPGSDVSLITFFLGAAPITAPTSIRFAT